ncbi:MAG: NUDIX hydrolase [Actinomycetota bacterium]|nr:NUDIX hydrolase [Actinomycetota bacterium]
MSFERSGGEEVWAGRIIRVRVDRFVHDDDGEEVQREFVVHPGAVAMVAHDGEYLYLVRQPREATGEQALLEVPAGKLDVEGEEPLETARRELIEEIGKGARTWERMTSVWASPGFTDERFHVFLATDLYDAEPDEDPDENERIEIVRWPLDRLDEAIEDCRDSKSLIGLLWFRAYRR